MILADVHDKFTAYDQRTNDLEEQLADLVAKFVWLEAENQSVHAWYTGHIISVWEGLQQLGEWMTQSMGAMVQVVGDDNAKHRHLAELMEEVHLCLGIPFQNPLPPAYTLLPPGDIECLAISLDMPPLEVPMATGCYNFLLTCIEHTFSFLLDDNLTLAATCTDGSSFIFTLLLT